ncbi:bile acid:sodium symporter [Aeromicrobium piscarium]|uniref:Arsenic resistance protein n=1 Tax=Aeromicrobium piscarium TaxID=2590901 RepID=A0A554SP74_9ACTN|nr:bile acid:sodium symporter [Aeromicrobium piscarium]TSD68154.1 arsenic resistance protein [Aeromicrobium piscarium]
MIARESLERHQVWCYLAGAGAGLAVGSVAPGAGERAEPLVWPVIALLLFATFTQIPATALASAFRDRRFLVTSLIANFVVMPPIVGGLVSLTPDDPALRLGLLLVLLAPCTDWFISFTQLGGGDASRATASSPVLLIAQLLLLPLYLAAFTGGDTTAVFTLSDLWPALLVIGLPLLLALAIARPLESTSRGRRVRDRCGWWPVPLLTVVITLVAMAHAESALGAVGVFPIVLAVAVGYLIVALLVAVVTARVARLPVNEGRTLVFTLATRNSFLVLPFALALPVGWETAAIVVVMQSIIELFAMIFYIWFVPAKVLRS